jgi:N-acyl homoserine lactone hydrolase
MSSQVLRVGRFSTGTVDIHPQHAYRGRSPMYWWILASKRWLTARPINVYVIEHSDGLVVFDTGQDRASVTDGEYFPGGPTGLIYRRLARFHVSEDETVTSGLASLGYQPSEVTTAVISHLHQDHIGGISELAHADLLVSADEWRSHMRPLAGSRGYLRSHIDVPGWNWRQLEFPRLADTALQPFTHGHDLFGDGSLVILPAPGHTPGSISMFVRRPGAVPLLLVGDLTYDIHALEEGVHGGVGSHRRLRQTREKVLALQSSHPGMRILAAHDPHAARLLDTANAVETGR